MIFYSNESNERKIMNQYHKIQTVFLRDPETKFKTLLDGQFAKPEFEYLADNQWVFTEKVDGTNIRVMYDEEGNVSFAGKTDAAQIPPMLLTALTCLFPNKLLNNACLYGEGYGNKIQKVGSNYRNDNSFVLFDVKVGDIWLERSNVEDIAKQLQCEVVPIIGSGTLREAIQLVKEGFNSQWGNFLAEGIVARPVVELQNRMGERVITKIKHKDFAK